MRTCLSLMLIVTVLVAACTDEGLFQPGDDGARTPESPSFAIVDAGHDGGVPGFWFLPPLAKQVTTEGTFDPNFEPWMGVCKLDRNPHKEPEDTEDTEKAVCEGSIAEIFPAGSAEVGDGSYSFSWKTKRKNEMDSKFFYRIHILLEDAILGYMDVNPQAPSGETPGEDYPDLYAFRLGETLPVKFFLNTEARCATAEEYVNQCTASAVIDEAGGTLTLESEGEPGWSTLSVYLPPAALPEGYPQVTLTMERIDPDRFLEETDSLCIPMFDAPQFGDCLRVTTDPEITLPLEVLATVEMCIDPSGDFGEVLKLVEEQDTRLQIVRFDDGIWQGLPNVYAKACPTSGQGSSSMAGLVPVPDDGLLRYAALGVNMAARFLGPEPVGAHGAIRLAGSTSEFSRFRWALPGQMTAEAVDGDTIQQQADESESYGVKVTVRVMDAGSPFPDEDGSVLLPSAIEGAMVHFSNGDSVLTLADGFAETDWVVPSTPGTHTLEATALGLLNGSVPDHGELITFTEDTVTFSATVVGVPSDFEQSPAGDPPLTGTPGGTLATPLVITVVDEIGQPVVGWDVTWATECGGPECTAGSITGPINGETPPPPDTETGVDGSATGYWTLSTTPGSNIATATVGNVEAIWDANGVCIVTVDGTISAGEWDCAVAAGDTRSFIANISGGETDAEVLWQNDGTNLYLAVKVQQSSLAKANSLRFDFDNDNGTDGVAAGDDAIAYDADSDPSVAFSDEHLTSRCVNRGQSGCGSLDKFGNDGMGAMNNDGTWTVYELSHPLVGTLGEDFVRAVGDQLGFFLTLRSGNGAQGNTQWPGFRIFEPIIIR